MRRTSSAGSFSHRQRNTTFAIRNLYIQTKISCKINKPKSVIRISLCRKAARNPLFYPK